MRRSGHRLIRSGDENVNVLVAVQGGDRYVILFTDRDALAAARQVGKWAADAELNLSWYTAATMCRQIRRLIGTAEE